MTTTTKRFVNKNILRQQFQPIELVGIPTANQPALSSSGEARVFYDSTLDAVRVSRNGAAYGSVLDGSSATPTEVSKLAGITGYPMQVAEVTFTETSGAGTYTGSVSLPAGATLHDIIINGVAVWNNAGTATLIVGDVADDNGYFDAVNLKATDLLAGESLSFSLAGGKAGAYIANAQVSPRYSASARVISGIITTSSTGGGTGRTRMSVVWSAPGAQAAAVKV